MKSRSTRRAAAKAVKEGKPNIEELAAKARAAREMACEAAVNKALDDHNCQMTPVAQLGDQLVTLNSILNLPLRVLISSK